MSTAQTQKAASPSEFLCLDCGYPIDLTGEPRCPECGRGFDPAKPSTFATARPSSRRTWAPRATVFGVTVGCGLAYVAIAWLGLRLGFNADRRIFLATILVGIVILATSCYRAVRRAPATERRRTIVGLALSFVGALATLGLGCLAFVVWALQGLGRLQ
jgi:hypothetical protein